MCIDAFESFYYYLGTLACFWKLASKKRTPDRIQSPSWLERFSRWFGNDWILVWKKGCFFNLVSTFCVSSGWFSISKFCEIWKQDGYRFIRVSKGKFCSKSSFIKNNLQIKTLPVAMSFSPNGEKIATLAEDRQIFSEYAYYSI